jgi:hypothetical protein
MLNEEREHQKSEAFVDFSNFVPKQGAEQMELAARRESMFS